MQRGYFKTPWKQEQINAAWFDFKKYICIFPQIVVEELEHQLQMYDNKIRLRIDWYSEVCASIKTFSNLKGSTRWKEL